MSARPTLTADIRKTTGKNANRKLRAQGIIPAVFYSAQGNNKSIQVNETSLTKVYAEAGRTTVLDLEINEDDKKHRYPCLIWDSEYYPTQNRFQHVDFYGIDLDKELKIRVPLEFSGVAKGTKLGGQLEIYREQIQILSKPDTLPKKIVVDITDLDIGQGLRIEDLRMPDGIRASYEINYAILMVTVPGSAKDEEGESATV
ncbi:MAG: 50S ribosomal protein L25/general stress protein Ctc [Desulfovibrio sp.]|jgi:large subunit ribosomal protein L25|nr:50S ribosomal protein L25/general stress protein Ctc [Desulfovibrio sp.]